MLNLGKRMDKTHIMNSSLMINGIGICKAVFFVDNLLSRTNTHLCIHGEVSVD